MAPARSPSSSTSSNRNPNALEYSGALRKIGSSNLSKSWSGSDIPHKNAVSKSASPNSSLTASFEQKENEREPNCFRQEKTRPFKGMKSFMAPTISTASKITGSSPRKKILAERNQVVRESTEFNIVSAEEKLEDDIRRKSVISIGSEEISGQNMSRKLDFSSSKDHHQPECSIVSTEEVKQEEVHEKKNVISIGSEEISGKNMSRKLDFSSSKEHHQPVFTHSHDSGVLDDDPYLPPYDPMKNYLSPRPRFLRYKPNPKIEQQDFLYTRDAMRFEDSFSDSENSGNAADCSDSADDETEDHVYPETHVSKSKPRSIGRSKLLSIILILTFMLSCIPFINTPLLTTLKTNDQSFAGPHTLPFRVLLQWPTNYIEKFFSFGSFPKEHMSHSLNMSSSSLVQSADLIFCYESDFKLERKNDMINEQVDEFQLNKTGAEALTGDGGDVAERVTAEFSDEVALVDNIVATEKIQVVFSDEEDNFPKYEKRLVLFTDPVVKFDTISEIEPHEKLKISSSEEVYGGAYPVEFNVAGKLEDNTLFALGNDQIDSSAYPLAEFEMADKKDWGVCPVGFNVARMLDDQTLIDQVHSSSYPIVEIQMAQKSFKDVLRNFITELQPFISSGMNLVLAVIGMFAAASMVFHFINLKQIVPSNINKSRYKKTKRAPNANNVEHAVNRDLNCHGGIAELVSDSGPTEMSSSFMNSLHQNEMRWLPVTPSPEITQRRESGVSSSVSYGSFTSYERRSRSARKGSNEEEVVTPVRRSSRIRNQISSPCI